MFRLVLTTFICLLATVASHSQPVSDPIPQFPGRKTSWNGFVRYDFEFGGRACRVVCPQKPANGNPWIWNARFPDWHTDIDSMLLTRIRQEHNGHLLGIYLLAAYSVI